MSKPQLYIKNEKGRYEPYKLDKASDIKEVSLAELGSLEKMTGEALEALPNDYRDSLEDVSDMVFKTLGIRHGNLIERERLLINQEKMMGDSIKIYLDSKPVVSK